LELRATVSLARLWQQPGRVVVRLEDSISLTVFSLDLREKAEYGGVASPNHIDLYEGKIERSLVNLSAPETHNTRREDLWQ
jgi:hypothetical protein